MATVLQEKTAPPCPPWCEQEWCEDHYDQAGGNLPRCPQWCEQTGDTCHDNDPMVAFHSGDRSEVDTDETVDLLLRRAEDKDTGRWESYLRVQVRDEWFALTPDKARAFADQLRDYADRAEADERSATGEPGVLR
jgi:hypothetical protein